MEERKSFLFYRSFWSGGSKLKPRERLAFYDALALYAFTGQEPELPYNAAICWEFAKPLIDSNNKKYEDGSKGGRPTKTSGFDGTKTTGSDSLKNISEEKEKEKEKGVGKGERRTHQMRKEKRPPLAVFESLPDSLERIGYTATENLKKKRIAQLEQAAQHTTAKPPDDDAETRQLKARFLQQLNPEAAAPANTPADNTPEKPAADSTQTPQPSGAQAHDQTDTQQEQEPQPPPG